MQVTNTLPLFCNIPVESFNKMTIKSISEKCADFKFDHHEDEMFGMIKESFKMNYNKTVPELLNSLNINMPDEYNLRKLLAISSMPRSLALLKPLKEFFKNTTNMTAMREENLEQLFMGNKTTYAYDELNKMIKSWYSIDLSKQFSLQSMAMQMNMSREELLNTSLSNIINFMRAANDSEYRLFLDASQLGKLCQTSGALLKEIHETCSIENTNFLKILDDSTVSSFTLIEINQQIAKIEKIPNIPFHAVTNNLFSSIVAGKAGLKRLLMKMTIPLVILANQHNVNLTSLRENPVIISLMNMFKIDSNVAKRLFPVPDVIYQVFISSPFKNIPTLEPGIGSIQQLYTGSIKTILTLTNTITDAAKAKQAIEENLPKYVKIIANNKFAYLSTLYEVSMTDLLDQTKFPSIYDIAVNFFGTDSMTLFTKSFDIDNKDFNLFKETNMHQVVDIGRYTAPKLGQLPSVSFNDMIKFLINFNKKDSKVLVSLYSSLELLLDNKNVTLKNTTTLKDLIQDKVIDLKEEKVKEIIKKRVTIDALMSVGNETAANYLLNTPLQNIVSDRMELKHGNLAELIRYSYLSKYHI